MRAQKIKSKKKALPDPVMHADLILKNIDEVIYYVTLDEKDGRKIVFLSDKIKDVLGFTKEKYLALGKKILDYCHPDDIEKIITATTRVLQKKVKNTFRYRFYNPKKKIYLWIEETIYPQVDKKKKLVGYFGVSRNVESEKRFEEQIIENEKKFRLLAENSSDIIFHFEFKPKPCYTYVSPSVKRILGYGPEDFYKDPNIGFKIIHPEDEKQLLGSRKNIKDSKPIKRTFDKLTARYKAKNGKTVWLENRYSPVFSGKEIVALHCVSRDVSEEKQKEQELADHKTQLSNLLSNLPGIAYRCLYDKNWTMKFISSGSYDLTGYKPEDFIDNKKRSFASIFHPEDRNVGQKEIKLALSKKGSFELECRIIHKDGTVKWIWEKGQGVYSTRGKLLYIEGFINDISGRKKVEDELSQEWLNYRNLVDSLPSGIFIHVNGKILFGNKAAYEITEIDPRKNPKDISLLDFLQPEDRPHALERIKKAMAGQTLPFTDYRVKGIKGTQKDVRVKAMPIIFNSMQAVQIVIQDVTLEKKLEEERIKAKITEQINQDLQGEIGRRIESEQKLKAIFESTSHLIWTVNKNKELTSFNRKYFDSVSAICGKHIFVGMKTTELKSIFSEEDYIALVEAQKTAFNGKYQRIEMKLNAVDGKTYYREMNFYPIIINGEINEIAAIAQDTTERRNNEKQITDQAAKLKAIFDSGSQRIWTVNSDFAFTSFNENFAKVFSVVFGKEPKINMSALESVKNTEYYDFWEAKYKEVLEGKNLEFETKHKRRDGEFSYGQVFFHPIKNEKGQVIEIAALSQDITDRKNAEKQIVDQSAKLKAIFDSGNQHIWTIDTAYRLTSFNKSYSDAHYYAAGTLPVLNKSVLEPVKGTPYYDLWKDKYDEALKGKNTECEVTQTMPDGKVMSGLIYLNPIFDKKNNVVEIAACAQDITLRKDHERKIVEQSARLKAIFESGSQLMWTVNKDIKLTSLNKNYHEAIHELYGIYPELGTKPGEHENKADSDEYHKFWDGKYEGAFNGETVEFYTERNTISGKITYRYIFLHPIYNEKNEVIEVSGIGYDISEQKRAEEEILNRQSRLSAIINNTSDIILSIDENYNLIEFNDILKQWVKKGFNIDLRPGTSVFDTMLPQHHAGMKDIYKRVFAGESTTAVGQFGTGQNAIFFETHYNPIKTGNKITGIAIFSRDITQQKKAEEEILNSLKEKDVLLKEVHHRVKNNLQVISSILNLQTAYLKDRGTINILKECQNRIKTMAFIHESLYQNKDFSQINFSEYIVTLVKNLFYSFETNQQKIRANFDVDTIFLNLDISIPCGLIVNELVSNALKYAFIDKEDGGILVQLKQAEGKIKMVISDNGIGIPETVNYKNTETLGLQLVNTLTEQINGSISMKRNKGTIFEIIF